MKKYKLISSAKINENGQKCVTYGIAAVNENLTVNDVFANKKQAKELVRKCNKYDLSPIHLDEIIQDFL